MSYERVKKNREDGLFDINALKRAYAVGIITKEQYKYIKSLPQKGTESPEDTINQDYIEAAKILLGEE